MPLMRLNFKDFQMQCKSAKSFKVNFVCPLKYSAFPLKIPFKFKHQPKFMPHLAKDSNPH